MEITRLDDKTILLGQLDLFLVELLRQIPVSADPQDSDAVCERLYTKPMHAESEQEFCEEWKSFVQPELQRHFQSATKTIKQDLEHFTETKSENDSSYALCIPMAHLEEWLNGLNQARLALAARFDFSEKDLDGGAPPTLESVRELSLLQIHFYGFLQEIFLRELE